MMNAVFPYAATRLAAICACLFSFVGLLGNMITILALLRSPKIRGHATTAFVLSLCVSDLLFCSINLPLTAARFLNEAWLLGDTLCKIFPVIFYGNVAVSLLSMVGITLNRFVLIACHNLYGKIYKPLYIQIQIFAVWLTSFLFMVPPMLGIWGELGLEETTFSCTILEKNGISIKKFLFLTGFLIPCFVILISYSCIFIIVRKNKLKVRRHRVQKVHTENKQSKRKVLDDHRITAMMLLIFVCFVICFLPSTLMNIIDEPTNFYPWLHILASIMAWASSVINPFIYAVNNKTYRNAYLKILTPLKFWGEPLSMPTSRSAQNSKETKNVSNKIRCIQLSGLKVKNDIRDATSKSIIIEERKN